MALLTLALAWGAAAAIDGAGAPLWVEAPFYVIAVLATIVWVYVLVEEYR